jgi:hypothetical protein
MVETLEEGLTRRAGKSVRITNLSRQPLGQASSFAAERLQLQLDDRQTMEVFFKDLNPKNQLFHARQVRNVDLERSERELNVYRRVLSKRPFGAPELYAFRWEPSRECLWLFLECIGGKRVSKLPDLEIWTAAAEWAADFHVASNTLSSVEVRFLPRLDYDHFLTCAEMIEEKLPLLAHEDREAIGEALRIYRQSFDRLLSLPQSVIHNEFFGKNIMVRGEDPARLISPVDWETAAIGPSFLDLVSLSSGRWNLPVREKMWRAYFDRFQRQAGASKNWDEFRQDLSYLSVYQVIRWLGWWPDRHSFPQFSRWMEELGRVKANFFPGPYHA